MRPLRKKATPREQDRALAERALTWTRLGATFAALAIVVAIIIGTVTITSSSSTIQQSGPVGVAVNTVPHERIGGAPIYPVPGGEPSDYLSTGVSLYVDCLQPIKPDHLLALISYGPTRIIGSMSSTSKPRMEQMFDFLDIHCLCVGLQRVSLPARRAKAPPLVPSQDHTTDVWSVNWMREQ
jgi:hypothetical protein